MRKKGEGSEENVRERGNVALFIIYTEKLHHWRTAALSVMILRSEI